MHVQHDAKAHRFVIDLDGSQGLIDYQLRDGVMAITHTAVPREIEGRGVASQLTRAAFNHARAEGLKIHPACSYAAAWSKRHPELSDVVV